MRLGFLVFSLVLFSANTFRIRGLNVHPYYWCRQGTCTSIVNLCSTGCTDIASNGRDVSVPGIIFGSSKPLMLISISVRMQRFFFLCIFESRFADHYIRTDPNPAFPIKQRFGSRSRIRRFRIPH
jgi:hypothetical protein